MLRGNTESIAGSQFLLFYLLGITVTILFLKLLYGRKEVFN